MNNDVVIEDLFFDPVDRVIETHGRQAFTKSTISLVRLHTLSDQTISSSSSTSSPTLEKRQIKRHGFEIAKKQLYNLLQTVGNPFEIITGGPILPGQQEAAHMVPSSAEEEFLLLLEYAFGFEPRTLAVHSRWNLAPVSQLYHKIIDTHGAFFLPSKAAIDYMNTVLVQMKTARLGELPDHLQWHNILHCGQQELTALHEYAFIPFGFSYHMHASSRQPLPIVQWRLDIANYVICQYPYTAMEDFRSHLSPFFVLANCYEKFRIWRSSLGNDKLPPMPPSPVLGDHPILNQARPILSSPERIERFRKMIGLFDLLDQMDTQRKDLDKWRSQLSPDLFRSPLSPSRSSRSSTQFSSPATSSHRLPDLSTVLYPAPDQQHQFHLHGHESKDVPPSETFASETLLPPKRQYRTFIKQLVCAARKMVLNSVVHKGSGSLHPVDRD